MTVSIGLGPIFSIVVGWVGLGQSGDGLGWVGSGHTKWTHGQLCTLTSPVANGTLFMQKKIGNESVPIQLAQCRFPELAIFNAKVLIYFSNKLYRTNFVKQHSKIRTA